MAHDAPTRIFQVPDAAAGTRLDAFLAAELAGEGVSRSVVQDLVRGGEVAVDGAPWTKPGRKLEGGQSVAVRLDLPGTELVPEALPLDVVHEDARLAVIDKPAGLTVHPAPGVDTGTLVHRVLHRWPAARAMDGERPGIVHRIDKDTSGLMVVALDEAARLALAEDFALRRVRKEYLALVHGRPVPGVGAWGEIDAPIGRHPRQKTKMAVLDKGGRDARSSWTRLWTSADGRASLLRVRIHTGRTHQIRVHMAHIGHPLLGDAVYGSREHAELLRDLRLDPAQVPRQMLHAWRLALTHPETGRRLEFFREPPRDFTDLARLLARRVYRVGLVGMPGCGKSALAGFLARDGVPVFSADRCVAELYEPGADGWTMLRRRFGPDMAPDGRPVAKAALFAAMRGSDAVRREVLDVVHPLVRHRLEEFWLEHAREELALAEVPLLLEGGWPAQGLTDAVLGVHCPEAARRDRLASLRGWDEATAAALESWQWPEADKLARCDLVAENAGDLDALRDEARRVLAALRGRAGAAGAESDAALAALWAPLPPGDGDDPGDATGAPYDAPYGAPYDADEEDGP